MVKLSKLKIWSRW